MIGSFLVPNGEPLTLQNFLKSKFPDTSLKALKRLVESGSCCVNDKVERFSSRKLFGGEKVVVKGESPQTVQQKFDPKLILFEDEALLVYNKPTGIISDGAAFLGSLPKGLKLVHRLDKETSGVLLFAKSEVIFQKMVTLFENELVHKEYLALCHFCPKKERGEITEPIGVVWQEGKNKRYGVTPKGQSAKTRYEVIGKKESYFLLRLEPITGRTHQLRVHLTHLGAPIVGDLIYGPKKGEGRLLLHAWKITFPHPVSHQSIQFEAPLPKEFT